MAAAAFERTWVPARGVKDRVAGAAKMPREPWNTREKDDRSAIAERLRGAVEQEMVRAGVGEEAVANVDGQIMDRDWRKELGGVPIQCWSMGDKCRCFIEQLCSFCETIG